MAAFTDQRMNLTGVEPYAQRSVLGAVILAAVLLLAAPALAQQQGVTADTVTIGAFGPITGPAAYIGLAGRDGMNLAIKEINAAGGELGAAAAVAAKG